jgi:hypothetical protein
MGLPIARCGELLPLPAPVEKVCELLPSQTLLDAKVRCQLPPGCGKALLILLARVVVDDTDFILEIRNDSSSATTELDESGEVVYESSLISVSQDVKTVTG